MDYRKMWYRLRKEMVTKTRQESKSFDERNYQYEDVLAKEILFRMLEMEEEKLLEE